MTATPSIAAEPDARPRVPVAGVGEIRPAGLRPSGSGWISAIRDRFGIGSRADRSGMSSRELLGWTGILFFGATMAAASQRVGGAGLSQPTDAIALIAWGCALLLGLRDRAPRPATARQIVPLLAIAAASSLMSGQMIYVGLTAAGLVVMLGRGWSPAERRIGLILVAIAMQKLWSKVVAVLFADVILRIDTAAAGIMLGVLVPGSSWSGNVLRPPDDVGVTVQMACSSFANLSLVCLCYTSLAALDGARWSRRNLVAITGVCAAIIVLNTVRLLLLARSLATFDYWHSGSGAEMFAIGTSVTAVALCSLGSRWANAR